MKESEFRECLEIISQCVREFKKKRQKVEVPSQCQADIAGYQLMEVVVQHVVAVIELATISKTKPGLHYVSSWVTLRAAFETALTCYWLLQSDDLKQRELRWASWITGEEKFYKDLAREMRRQADDSPRAEEAANEFQKIAQSARTERRKAAQLLLRKSDDARPSIPAMMFQSQLDRDFYLAYMVGSGMTHATPIITDELFEMGEGRIRTKRPQLRKWLPILKIAGWSVTLPGITLLIRSGANESDTNALYHGYRRLLEALDKALD